MSWPANVERIDHLAPPEHPAFYASQRITLNLTCADLVNAGYSPSVRLFEAAACGVPIISDRWTGLETIFEPGREILVADSADEVIGILRQCDDAQRRAIGLAGRTAILQHHTAAHRAQELEAHLAEAAAAGREPHAAAIPPLAAAASL